MARGKEFEKLIGKTFQAYRDAKVAHLVFMHPPMRPAFFHGGVPCFIQSGKAPYDVIGFYYDGTATSIGAELKETKEHESSLPIVGEDKKGNGLQQHQLEGLVNLHEQGGAAFLVWENAGEVGILRGERLSVVNQAFQTARRVEKFGKTPTKGSKSIPWGWFEQIKQGVNGPLWLPKSTGCGRN